MITLASQQIRDFRNHLSGFYKTNGRFDMPWRRPEPNGTFEPYKILVSELMLQQTQVARVVAKYDEFLLRFPTIEALAGAPLSDVLQAWQGLGYNRRAKYLWQAARAVVNDFAAQFPADIPALQTLPGVGANTAGAIVAYAFDCPVVFVETNVRTVLIYTFFPDQTDISDRQLREVLGQLLPDNQIREFYYALMDYGSYLKKTMGNFNRRSTTYGRQSPFTGSRRQIRGQIIRVLVDGSHNLGELQHHITDERLPGILSDLVREGMITERNGTYELAG